MSNMSRFLAAILGTVTLVSALNVPLLSLRTVQSLNQGAFEEAQQRDATATRAFSATQLKTSTGQCLFVDELSGDFRANLNPIQVGACNGSIGQQWDVITAGKHNDDNGTMLLVNTLTQACINFDPRRAAGNTVIMFSCGGRADGGGGVTNSQQFPFSGGAGPLALSPKNAAGTCLAVKGAVLDQAPCKDGDTTQRFTFDGPISTPGVSSNATSAASRPSAVSSCMAEVTTASKNTATSTSSSGSSAVAVSRAGGVLNPSAAAEANPVDTTAVKAFSSTTVKSSAGQCLTIDPNAGDFRENLIPVTLATCDGGAGQAWDIVTKGQHNDATNAMLVVSSLTQGCLNFDPRRVAGDTVVMFSCGGRADGGGGVTNSQLFAFESGQRDLALVPESGGNTTCLIASGVKLDSGTCSNKDEQRFTIG